MPAELFRTKNSRRNAFILFGLIVAGLAVLLLRFGGRFFPPRQLPTPVNVLLITLDTTRADHLGIYGHRTAATPNIDRLAGSGWWLANAYAPVPLTFPSHCSIMTGSYPPFHGARTNGAYILAPGITTLAEILQRRGFATAAFVSSFTLDSRYGLNQGFETFDDRLTHKSHVGSSFFTERIAEITYNAFHDWLGRRPDKPFFSWVHFFDPHLPYAPPEPFRSRFQSDPYDGEIAYLDQFIGRIVNDLEDQGLADTTLLVIAGDHGEAFGEHLETGHQVFCYQETLKVPLVFCLPTANRKGKARIDQPATLTDIMPTILDLLGVPIPGDIQGRSLRPALQGREMEPRDLYFESLFAQESLGCAALTGLIHQGRFKYIDLPEAELYDLDADPLETRNLISSQAVKARQMKKDLCQLAGRISRNDLDSRRSESPEERRLLASLGYISSAPPRADADAPRPDPKDVIAAFLEFNRGNDAEQAGNLAQAAVCYEKAIAMGLQFAPVYLTLTNLHYGNGRSEAAENLLLDALKKFPGSADVKTGYATLLLRLNRPREALAFLIREKETVALPYQATMLTMIAGIYEEAGKADQAWHYYRQARDTEPGNAEVNKRLGFFLLGQGRFHDALASFQTAEKAAGEDYDVLKGLAITWGQLGDFTTSENYFLKAMALNPGDAAFDFAAMLATKGDFQSARQRMEQFLELARPSDPRRELAQRLVIEFRKRSD